MALISYQPLQFYHVLAYMLVWNYTVVCSCIYGAIFFEVSLGVYYI